MKSYTTVLVLAAILALTLSACSKEEKKEEPKPDYNGMIADKDWIRTGWTFTFSSGSPLDRYANLPPCEKDDLFEFKANKQVWLKAGDTKCNPADEDSQLGGTWAFIADDTKLQIVSGDTSTYDLVKLDGSVLQLKSVTKDPVSGITQTEELNLARK